MLQRLQLTALVFALCSIFALSPSIAADAPKAVKRPKQSAVPKSEIATPIKPEQAKEYLNKVVTVEFVVVAAKELLDKNNCFLNSDSNLKSPTNFTAFIRNAKKFKEVSKIEKPADHYLKKTVQVTGKIVKYKEKLEIVVESPEQIKIVEEMEKSAADEPKPAAAK